MEDLTGILDSIEPIKAVEDLTGKQGEAPEIPIPEVPKSGEAPEPQYAHDMSRQIDVMYRNGATTDEVTNFIAMAAKDPSKMDVETLARESIRMDNPGLSDEDVQELYEEQYGDDTVSQRAARNKAAVKARQRIEEIRKTSQEPASVRKQKEAEQHQTQLMTGWAQVADSIAEKRMANIEVKIPAEGGEYAFNYPVTEEARKQLAEAATLYAVQNNIPLTKEGVNKNIDAIQDHMRRVAFYINGPEMVEAAIRDAITKGVRMGRKQGVNPSTGRQEPIVPQANDFISERRKNGLTR